MYKPTQTTAQPITTITPLSDFVIPEPLPMPSREDLEPDVEPAQPINCTKFEDSINRWTNDLIEQEKVFMAQATQINAWDEMVSQNGRTLSGVCHTVRNVMVSQQQILCDLDFIATQQQELESCITVMEQVINRVQILENAHQRKQLYELSETLDSTLKRLSEDLKELIEIINEQSLRGYNPDDPLLQIGRVLNTNVNALKWIEIYANKTKVSFDKYVKEQEEIEKRKKEEEEQLIKELQEHQRQIHQQQEHDIINQTPKRNTTITFSKNSNHSLSK